MLILQTPSDLLHHVGRKLGTSDWFTIEQRHIDGFAQLTGDDFWIHVDVQRAASEMPGTTLCEFEIEGSERPALVAEFILLIQDA